MKIVVSASGVDLDPALSRLGKFRRVSAVVDANLLNGGERKVCVGPLHAIYDDGRRGSASGVDKGAERRENVAIFHRQIGKCLLVERKGVLMSVGSRIKPGCAAVHCNRIPLLCERQRDTEKAVFVR